MRSSAPPGVCRIPLGPLSAPRWKPPPFTAIFSPPCLWSIYRTSWGRKPDLSLTVRGLAAAEQGEQVILLLWDGGSRYYQCATAVQRSALQEVLEQFDFGVSTFAFEEEAGQHLAPLSLFPDPLPELPQLTAGDAAVSTETLLTALGFNPHTNSRYVDSGGAEVIVEGDRVIRLGSSGALSYSSGGEAL